MTYRREAEDSTLSTAAVGTIIIPRGNGVGRACAASCAAQLHPPQNKQTSPHGEHKEIELVVPVAASRLHTQPCALGMPSPLCSDHPFSLA